MTKSHYYILAGVVLLVILALIPQSLLERTAYRLFYNVKPIGQVHEVIGRTEKSISGSTQLLSVSAGDAVNASDTYITHGDSKILFKFDPPFWLMPYSKIEFIRNAGSVDDEIIGHLIYGEIKKSLSPSDNINRKEANAITLTYDNKMIDGSEFSSSVDFLETPLVTLSENEFKDIQESDNSSQNMVEKQIFQTLLLHKKFFQGCLIKLYKKESGATRGGETVFDLLIQVNGVIEKTTISKSDIQDQEYISCLKQVFARVRFKNLQIKEPLHALFPLNIEMP